MKNLTFAKVLITGAARGIGREQALCFADEGADIILTDVDEEALRQTWDEVAGRGTRCWRYIMDVTDPKSVQSVRSQIHQQAGPISVLVNNAGIVSGGPFVDVALDEHLATYAVNVSGLVGVTHAFLGDLIAQSDAHLVNIASASGFIGLPFGATYASSKWAVIGFSESLRLEMKELGHTHVKVTTVCPSYISTGMFSGAQSAKLTKMLDPAELASSVVEAVKRDDLFVYAPWLVKLTPFLKGILPVKAFDFIANLLGATSSMAQWQGHRG